MYQECTSCPRRNHNIRARLCRVHTRIPTSHRGWRKAGEACQDIRRVGMTSGADTSAPRVKRRVVGLGRSLLIRWHHAASAAVGLGSARTRRSAPKRRHPDGLSGGPARKAASHPQSKRQGQGTGAGSREGGGGVSWKFALEGGIRGIPSPYDPVLRSARGSL